MTKHIVLELDARAILALAEGNEVNLGPIAPDCRVTLRRKDAPKTNIKRPKTKEELMGEALT